MTGFIIALVLASLFCYAALVRNAILAMREAQKLKIRHFSDVHFTGVTIDGMKFVYCPVGRIISWSPGDYDNKYCHYEEKFFNELKG